MFSGKKRPDYYFSTIVLILALFLLISIPCISMAETPDFSSVFGSNMVLPHDKPFTLSGYASPNTELTLEADGYTYKLKSNIKGEWKTQI